MRSSVVVCASPPNARSRCFSLSSTRTSQAVARNPAAEMSISVLVPTRLTSSAARAGPPIVPTVPPAARNPNSRLAWLREKVSAIRLQNTEMMSTLKVLTHTKKSAATQRSCCCSTVSNSP